MAPKTSMAPPAPEGRPKSTKTSRKSAPKAGTGVMQTMLQAAETRTQVTNPNEQLQTTEQSLEIMQQLLFGIVSNLASARNFFKPDVYGLVDYHFECEETGGNGFSTEGKTTFTGLKRGVSKRVNYLLNFLDNGVRNALRDGVLGSLNFIIYEQKNEPKLVVERWVIKFVYTTDVHTGTRYASRIEVTEEQQSTEKITVGQAKSSLIHFIQQVVSISCSLPKLPSARFMTIEMHYNDHAPAGYEVPDFVPIDLETSTLSRQETWKEWPVASMNAGFHEASLSVGYSTRLHPNTVSQPLQDKLAESPDNIDNGVKTTAATQDARTAASSRPQRTRSSKAVDISSSSAIDNQLYGCQPDAKPVGGELRELQEQRTDVHSKADRRTKLQISKMLQDPKTSTALPDTQTAPNAKTSSTPARKANLGTRVILSDYTIKLLKERNPASASAAQTRPKRLDASEAIQGELQVHCECRHNEVEGTMMLCQICGHYQHINCYGYLGITDTRIPPIHICYTCLFDKQPVLLREPVDLAVYRRACYLLRSRIFDGSAPLTEALGCTAKFTSCMLQKFRGLGMMSSNPQKEGSKAQLTMPINNTTNEVMINTFFDPKKGIMHYCEEAPESTTDDAAHQAQGQKRPPEPSDMLQTPKAKKPFGSRAAFALDITYTATPSVARKA